MPFLEMWTGPYRSRVVMLLVFNFFQAIGYYGFANWVSNPFPELSALVPISGPGTQEEVTNTKVGLGIRFRL